MTRTLALAAGAALAALLTGNAAVIWLLPPSERFAGCGGGRAAGGSATVGGRFTLLDQTGTQVIGADADIHDNTVGEDWNAQTALTLKGNPDPLTQALAREVKLMDALIVMIRAVSASGIRVEVDQTTGETLDPRFSYLISAHRLAYTALCKIVWKHHRNEEYFVEGCIRDGPEAGADAGPGGERETLAAKRGAQQHGQKRHDGEDHRAAGRTHVLQAPVQKDDEHAELRDAEQADRQQVTPRHAHPAQHQQRWQQAEAAENIAHQRQRGRVALLDHRARGHHGRAHQDPGPGCRQQRQGGAPFGHRGP